MSVQHPNPTPAKGIAIAKSPEKLLTLKPIGYVESTVQRGEHTIWEELEARIVLESHWQDALQGLEEFSHIIVIFWLDRPDEADVPLKVHPEARDDLPLVGLFATRTPLRPNPIGLTTVELLSVEGTTLSVKGLDAFDGTPVLDIKPYLVRGDQKPDASVPGWLQQLWERHDYER